MLTHPIRRALYGGAAGLMLTGLSVAGATAAGASTDAPAAHHGTITAVTQLTNRPDSGGNGNWAYDTFHRQLVLSYLGKSRDSAHAAAPYMYSAVVNDRGSFKDIPGAFTPNQGAPYTGKILKPTQVKGTMTGDGKYALFYASNKASKRYVPSRIPSRDNPAYPSVTWPELAFPAGTVFSQNMATGADETSFAYYYAYSFKTHHGKAVRMHTQKWADTAWNGDGQNKHDGNILGR